MKSCVASSVVAFCLLIGQQIGAKETIFVRMRDGVELATDVHKGEGTNALPVILGRTPYNKNSLDAIGTEAMRRGFILVAQDCRGRFASEGENLPFNLDGPDGFDTLEWITKQTWCNGKIGTWGGSAGALTQFQMITSGTDKISAQHLTVGAPNLYEVVYINGVFRKALVEDWLRGAQWGSNALARWVAHPIYDDYWSERDASRDYKKANAPALHIGGYWDIFAQGTIDAFVGYQEKGGPKARGKQRLVMGPWTHGVLQEKAGELTFPNAKNPPGKVHDAWKWFDLTLKGNTSNQNVEPAVTYYVIGDVNDPKAPGNVWRTADHWPPVQATPTKYFLRSDRSLGDPEPGIGDPLSYTYDPANPAPTVGGPQLTIPAGPMDQKTVEARADVLVFTSPQLTSPIEVTGRVRAQVWVSADVPDTDFIARLCDVYPDGRSFNLCEGAIRARFRAGRNKESFLEPGKIYPMDIYLWSTSVIFNSGHRLRLQISSSSAPGYDPNPNTGAPFRANTEARKANLKLYVDSGHPSHVVLPVVMGTGR
ncbi:MAG: putative acylase and diesterase [Verrucomicrobiales bacterium]|nr:putative acylase and diesterase [Verrucomicrobiales bacterium]